MDTTPQKFPLSKPTSFPILNAPKYVERTPSKLKPSPSKQTTPPEAARHPIETLKKWEQVMVAQWKELYTRLINSNIHVESILEIGKPDSLLGTIEAARDSIYVVVGQGRTRFLDAVISRDDFDIETLVEFRRLVKESIDKWRTKIEETEKAAEKAASEKRRKLKEVLPKIIDEFGADVMQFSDEKPKSGKDKDEEIPF